MVALKAVIITTFAALAAAAVPVPSLLPPIDLGVTNTVSQLQSDIQDGFEGTPVKVVGDTVNPDVSVGAINPQSGTASVGVAGNGLLKGVDVTVGGEKRGVNIDL